MTEIVEGNLPPARCPNPTCRARLVARLAGLWCPRCRGWLLSYRAEGVRRWYVGTFLRSVRT